MSHSIAEKSRFPSLDHFMRLIAPLLVSIFALVFISSLRDISTTVLSAGSHTRPLSLLTMEFATAGTLEPAAAIGVILSAFAVFVALIRTQTRVENSVGIDLDTVLN